MPEVVRALEVPIVSGPEHGGIAGLEIRCGPLELGRSNGAASINRPQIQQSGRADDPIERNLLDGDARGVEAEGAVQMSPNVVGCQENAALARLGVLVKLTRGS